MTSLSDKKAQLFELLKIHYGFENFRPGQERAIENILEGRDTVVIMPTGGGKSLIFQLPALILEGITIVISPLISLMKDQVDSLSKIGIPATFINSSISQEETDRRLEQIKSGFYKIIYIAPERFYNQNFADNLKKFKVSLFAIDEAHCISQWGHDFRPSYLKLKQAIKAAGQPVVVALTATATPEVRADIAKQLELKNHDLVITGFARPNLQFGVIQANEASKLDMIVDAIRNPETGSGIVYVGTRNKADELAEILNDNDVQAVVYHAGMDNESREWVQNSFMSGQARVVVATNAFGLGINKKDIRFVIHHDMPGTLEAYYQEAGRAGRDGLNSFCLLFYAPKDRYLREFFIKGDNPSPNIVLEIYDFLANYSAPSGQEKNSASAAAGSILITYAEIAKHLSEQVPEMAIGTSLKILEREGYISRPNEKTSNAYLKISESFDKLTAALGTRAKMQLAVAEKLNGRFADKLAAGWEVNLEDLAGLIDVKKDTLARTIKKLADGGLLEYTPPFRGTEIKILKKVPAADVEIDFRALKNKLERAYEKLDEMEGYVYHLDCRQEYILRYFGEKDAKRCDLCDNCLRGRHLAKKTYLVDVD